jgi:DNA mismatch repair protein MutL
MLEKLALSHPDISFKYINNNQTRLHTSGNGNRKDLIYHIYGREIASSLLRVDYEGELFSVSGFIGKPVINRGNRNYENYFINGRYIKSTILAKAIEEAYKSFLMQHQYPFTVLYFTFPSETLDVNVHPTKMELRFGNGQEIYKELCDALYGVLSHRELIPDVPVEEKKEPKLPHVYREPIPEPFEKRRINQVREAGTYQPKEQPIPEVREKPVYREPKLTQPQTKTHPGVFVIGDSKPAEPTASESLQTVQDFASQVTLESISPDFLTEDARKKHRIIGQLFATYWLIEYEDKLYIIDQHAAHEKVLYERTMARLGEKEFTSQSISPPIVLTLDAREQEMLEQYREQIERFGYVVEPFGGKEYMISAVPDNLFHMDMKDLFIEMLDDFSNLTGRQTPDLILEKVASMSCKAAVKGNDKLSLPEIDALIGELLTLENPFNCPHGRPTIIAMSKYEIEKKFKRIV